MQISLLGRIATIKMNVLPKLLYLFQTIPIYLNRKFFKGLDKITMKFIWAGKKARIKKTYLQDNKSRGGFGLPAWQTYYRGASLVWIKDWIKLENKRVLILEGHDLQIGWHAFLWNPNLKIQRYTLRKSLIKIWLGIRNNHYIKIPTWLSTVEAMFYPNNGR
uniref:Reverse transcriptase zinc-binding domain-containing protein n=1 Tax=Micrurus lemniscatus lemniscatus TaxID=129467 RepID=A0A2D4HBJ0_MICLE